MPYVMAVTLVLLIGTALVLSGLVRLNENKEENTRVNIGVTGDMENKLLSLGLNAFKTFDDTKYSIELLEYEESEAETALKRGEIAAYVVMPEDFIENALYGNVKPVRFVTTAESSDVVTMFKNEILKIVTDLVVDAQKGTYGIGDALDANGYSDISGENVNNISMKYFELVIKRNSNIKVSEIGVANSLTTTEYYLLSIFIFLIMLVGLPFASLYSRSDNALSLLLSSKGISPLSQLFCEFLAHLLSLLGLTALVFGVITLADIALGTKLLSLVGSCPFLQSLPFVIMLSAFNIMIFELFDNLISGLLSHFFIATSLCYISGCFFPIHSFPTAIQNIASALPVCLARQQMSSLFTGNNSTISTLWLVGYALVFFALALIKKRSKLKGGSTV